MFWALEICWKYWLIRIKLDVINSLRHMKAEIQPFRRLNLTVSMWLEAFSIIIELSHKILWEEFRIKTNHKGRLRIAAFQSYNSKDYGWVGLSYYSELSNKHGAHLILFEKFFLPAILIRTYTFIYFCRNLPPTWLLEPPYLFIFKTNPGYSYFHQKFIFEFFPTFTINKTSMFV